MVLRLQQEKVGEILRFDDLKTESEGKMMNGGDSITHGSDAVNFDSTLPVKSFEIDLSIEATVVVIGGWIEKALHFQDGKTVLPLAGTPEVCLEDKQDGTHYADGVDPPDGLFFALGSLDTRDLLTVQCVCNSLRDAVRDDPLLWRSIVVSYPLSNFITNDYLMSLTGRARGTLRSLSLVSCYQVTSSGLRRVLEANPQLTKLSVAGSVRLSAGSVYEHVNSFNSSARPGVKRLQIGGLCGLTNELFNDFKLLLGDDGERKSGNCKPRFFSDEKMFISLEDERAIDVEVCSRCLKPMLVYDCPADGCRDKIKSSNPCRACIICISRCICCGCCLENRIFQETFFLDTLCFECWLPPRISE